MGPPSDDHHDVLHEILKVLGRYHWFMAYIALVATLWLIFAIIESTG